MRPGDKVRFIHSKGEGIVRKIIDAKNIEVEIEDGFIVPFQKNELVVVSSEETIITGSSETISTPAAPIAVKGTLWFAFVPFNDKVYSVYLANDTTQEVLFAVGQKREESYEGIYSGKIKSGESIKITNATIADFEHWPEWIIQSIFFNSGFSELKEPLFRTFKLKANSFFKSKQLVPILQKEGYAFPVNTSHAIKVQPDQLVENMFKSQSPTNTNAVSRPAKEIDLHIEKLVSDHSKLSNSEMLKIQMQEFEKNLDNAIASGMEEIIFIHGIGNGVLRQELHKTLSKNKNIKFYQDARKEKFGYGATLVRIK